MLNSTVDSLNTTTTTDAPSSTTIPPTVHSTTASTATKIDTKVQKNSAPLSTDKTTTASYLVAVGSFKDQDKAQIRLNRMIEQGFPDAYLYKHGDFIRVIIAAFRSEQKAKELSDQLVNQGIYGYVFKR